MKTTAIIVAAGTGSRFNSDTPKQFVKLAGRPLIEHTIERFDATPSVDEIILVLARDRAETFLRSESGFEKLRRVIIGGTTRAESVQNGLAAAGDAAIVAVHDGARPFVSVDEIERTISKAKETGAACLVATVTDTIKTVSGGEIAGTLDREKLRRALTPQVFRTEILRRAFELAGLSEAVTDECYLVEKLGHPIAFVEGSQRNIKITHPEDLAVAEAILSLVGCL
ncbi:MAG TPA: 2-C-methyl-D-erythritol 4-phosphate cytidylyltransferase [Pyrinomonadaceae bacterium]|nr:2-C-methyl-D-erythritol 4-phosphate cytidylyltransferase [Pyrinomonadaceae bacterium]